MIADTTSSKEEEEKKKRRCSTRPGLQEDDVEEQGLSSCNLTTGGKWRVNSHGSDLTEERSKTLNPYYKKRNNVNTENPREKKKQPQQKYPFVDASHRSTIRNHNPSYLLPTPDSEDEVSDEDSTDQSGAFPIQDRRRGATGPSTSDGQRGSDGANTTTVQPELNDTPDEVAIQDAYLAGQGSNRRRRNNNPIPLLLEGEVERIRKNYMKWIVGSFVVLLAATLTALLVFFSKKNDEQPVATSSISLPPTRTGITLSPTDMPSVTQPSAVPSTPPTVSNAPTSTRLTIFINEIRRQFHSPQLESDLQNPSSPQFRAALWMAEEDRSDMTLGLDFPITEEYSIFQFRQRYSLAAFYYSTGGESWSEQCNFVNEDLHVCNWNCDWNIAAETDPVTAQYIEQGYILPNVMGVECENWNELSQVWRLAFVGNNLRGTLPEELQGLDNLFALDLVETNIGSKIPWMAFNDTYLHRTRGSVALGALTLLSNQLTGTIPEEIGEITSLRTVWLQDNLLTGGLPSFSNIRPPPLTYLVLSNSMLSGTIPSTLFRLDSLRFLVLNGNRLRGTIPDKITLPRIDRLDLENNDLYGRIPDAIGSCTSLTYLNMAFNGLSGTVMPTTMSRLSSLQFLHLSVNQLTGVGLNWSVIGGMTDIREILVGSNHIMGTIPTEIAALTALEIISVGFARGESFNSSLVGTLPTELGSLRFLDVLDLSRNNFHGTVPTEIGMLSSLGWLMMNENWGLTGELPTELNSLRNIGAIRVQNTSIIGDFSILCNNYIESNHPWKTGLAADCLEDKVICDCCVICCDDSGNCVP